ncbi:MAG: hypothetical protein IJ410_01240 [Oscillospiraceae bacterium]|nr:hypothetical protein [Oscillospiraceae bacterium]
MGLRDKYAKKLAEQGFKPLELTEENVQAIFNRCLATNDTPKENISRSIIFSRTFGYKQEDQIVFSFDKDKLLANSKNIKYLYGQLKSIHSEKGKMSFDETYLNYSGINWTTNKTYVVELLHLGCTHETLLVSPFNAETNSTLIASSLVTPTLSTKDSNFPLWWEQHKAEWE